MFNKRPMPRVTGRLEAHAAGFWDELARLGYSNSTAVGQLHLMAHLSRWLDERQLSQEELSPALVEQFLADRRAGRVVRLTPQALKPLLSYLRRIGAVPEPVALQPEGLVARVLEEFATFLVSERGLAVRTIVAYRRLAEVFLDRCLSGAEDDAGMSRLGAEDVNAFLLAECARRSVGSARQVATALRALLRFLHLRGYIDAPLGDCVPQAAAWRDTGRSKAVDPGQVRRLLKSRDRRTASGRRDFAILTLLARMGLRANEVATLALDDISWHSGLITVSGKGGRQDRLPLPTDVGKAIADYCQRGRARSRHRSLFLQVRAPYGPLTSDQISQVVVRACRRAGLPRIGAHRLRHTAATEMRRAGAPLFEVGRVLRHRRMVSTALYAKDDLTALAAIARPWPGARP
jgi:site-specific recombinase XerD